MPQHSMAPMLFGLRVVMLGRQGSGKGDDMPSHLRSEIHHFFDVYKALEPGKSTSTTGFEGREAALGEIAASRARLLHQQHTAADMSQPLQQEPAPA